MTKRNAIQIAFDDFAKNAGFVKRSGTWYRREAETIVVIQLQKSQYSLRYCVNLAVWLLVLGDADYPREPSCHIRTRLAQMLPSETEAILNRILDLEDWSVDESERGQMFVDMLRSYLDRLLKSFATVDGLLLLRSDGQLRDVLITGSAQRVLQYG